MFRSHVAFALIACSFAFGKHLGAPAEPEDGKHRVIVLTDIGADPDDTMSLVRLLTYANVIDIEGLVATTSEFQEAQVHPEMIVRVLDAYGEAWPSLSKHEPGYPTFAAIKALVSRGLPVYGMQGVGERKDSPGSELIISELRRPDKRPLWICVWGGTSVLAQALWKIKETVPNVQATEYLSKLRIYAISDQDDSGSWIRREFPSLFYICSPGSFSRATWTGLPGSFQGGNNEVITPEWLAKNIQQGHGPLGAAYPDVAYGMEGDTPSFLSLIPNGLNDPEHPDYGGWGGRYEFYTPKFVESDWHPVGQLKVRPEPETRPLWTNAEDSYRPRSPRSGSDGQATGETMFKSAQATIWRWREEIQNDFAARICWATKPYGECNHPPVPVLATPKELTVVAGESFYLDATGSRDPDGDSLSYYWFQYGEASNSSWEVNFRPFAQNLIRLPVTAPNVTSPTTVHFILSVRDKGSPPLTRYARVIVHVLPHSN
jgi:Protein of unknown function (DUF1593)